MRKMNIENGKSIRFPLIPIIFDIYNKIHLFRSNLCRLAFTLAFYQLCGSARGIRGTIDLTERVEAFLIHSQHLPTAL